MGTTTFSPSSPLMATPARTSSFRTRPRAFRQCLTLLMPSAIQSRSFCREGLLRDRAESMRHRDGHGYQIDDQHQLACSADCRSRRLWPLEWVRARWMGCPLTGAAATTYCRTGANALVPCCLQVPAETTVPTSLHAHAKRVRSAPAQSSAARTKVDVVVRS